jgi:hypothetical protein
MLGIVFERYIVSWYGSYGVANNDFKYIHSDFTNASGYFIITLIVGSTVR